MTAFLFAMLESMPQYTQNVANQVVYIVQADQY